MTKLLETRLEGQVWQVLQKNSRPIVNSFLALRTTTLGLRESIHRRALRLKIYSTIFSTTGL